MCPIWRLERCGSASRWFVENQDYVVEQDASKFCSSLLDKRDINARIEPGAIRDQVEIGDNAVIMMEQSSISVLKSVQGP